MQRLKFHLLNLIDPLLPDNNPVASEEVTAIFCGTKFYELELVTVKHLNSKITSSFTAGREDTQDGCRASSKCCHPPLRSAPVFLVGVLKFRADPPTLFLADKTGEIPCEVSMNMKCQYQKPFFLINDTTEFKYCTVCA